GTMMTRPRLTLVSAPIVVSAPNTVTATTAGAVCMTLTGALVGPLEISSRGVRYTNQSSPEWRSLGLTIIWPKPLSADTTACVPAGVCSKIWVAAAAICEAGGVQETDSVTPSNSVEMSVSGANKSGAGSLTMPGLTRTCA